MKLSVKSDYASRAVLVLARHHPTNTAMRVEQLAVEQGIPPKFLVQILLELKGQGIVRSLRGKEGGYLLARPPAEISLGDIIRAVHGDVFDTNALEDTACPHELRRAWKSLRKSLNNAADAINFEQLLEDASGKEKMYYI